MSRAQTSEDKGARMDIISVNIDEEKFEDIEPSELSPRNEEQIKKE